MLRYTPVDPIKVEEIALLIDKHNNNVDKPVGNEFIQEKDKLLRHNSFLDYHHHHAYELAGIAGNIYEFFLYYNQEIMGDIHDYDFLSLSKLYYESNNKALLSEKMELY